MGLFLQTAVIPGGKEGEARKAVEQLAACSQPDLDPKQCRYGESGRGCTVLFNDGCCGYDKLAQKLSAVLPCPVLLLYIYDEDFWGYFFYGKGEQLDCFNPMPDYFGECPPGERRLCAGDSALLARYFQVEQGSIERYLRFWTEDMMERCDETAYPEDEFGQCDCWQMADFMGRLGFPYGFGEGEAKDGEPVRELPPLEEILSKRLTPLPTDAGVYTLASLPSVLDGDYIRNLVTGETGELLRLLGSQDPHSAWEGLYKLRDPKKPDPVICMLLAYCACQTGEHGAAYYQLYEAMPPALPFMRQSTNGLSGPDVILLLRARSLVVPVSVKRHISCRDLERLRELDPQNEDVYLLALSFFHYIDTYYQGSSQKAYADLEELSRIGFPKRGDSRIRWEGFPEDFLKFCERGGAQIRAGEIRDFDTQKHIR